MESFPISYKDETYDNVDSSTEQKLGIPAGLLSSIRLHGEKSNADQVSSAGARTPYQITPSTRKLILKKYGIDPYLSPDLASEGAGLLLQESLKRNQGNIEDAIGEYHGGTDRKNWGSVNKAYRARVVPKAEDAKVSRLSDEFSAWAANNPAPDNTGSIESDFGNWLSTQKPEEAPKLPPTVIESAQEMVTGTERSTPESEAATELGSGVDIRTLVEGSGLDNAGIMRLGADTLTATNPEEAAAIIQKQTGGVVSPETDEKGNIFLKNSKTGQSVIINKPGLSGMDAFQGTFIGGLAALAMMPAGRVATAVGAPGLVGTTLAGGALSAGTQAGIEAEQASQGGEFNKTDVALAGAIPIAVPAITSMAKTGINAIAPKVMQGVNAVKTMGKSGAQVADVVDNTVQAVDNVAPAPVASDVVQQADNVAPVAPRATPEEITAIANAPDAIPSTTQIPAQDFGALARKASEGSRKAQEELAAVVDINPEAKAAADSLGLELPIDLVSDSKLLKQTAGLSRGIVGAESEAWKDTVEQVGKKADEALNAMDGSTDIATLSETVKSNLGGLQKELDDSASAIYKKVDDVVPKSSMADLGKTRETISSVVSEVGEGNLSSAEKRLYELSTNPKTTYGALLREKNQIGSALKSAAGNNPYGSVETGTLKRLYGALADDQLSTVEKAVGGEAGAALRQDLHYANRLTAQRKALEKRIVNAFGKEGEGSIASKLVSAIKSGAKGDVTGLNKVLKAVPKDLHKETIVTALMNSARTPQGNFSPNAFANLYQGIRGNAPVAKTVFGTLSKEENETLRSIYTIAKRTRDAENAVSKTGKANQPLYDALIAQNAIGALLDSAAGKMAQNAVGAIPSGGAARALTSKVAEALTTTPAERLTAVNSLLNSPQFSDLLEAASKAGSGEAPDRVVKGLARSKVFSDFAKSVNMSRDMTDRERFIAAMLQGSKGAVTEDKQKGKF